MSNFKTTFVAFEVEDGALTPHDHPVFMGDIAYDLGDEQEVQMNESLGVREFTSPGDLNTAIVDYMREHEPKADRVPVSPFIVLAVIEAAIPVQVSRARKRSNLRTSETNGKGTKAKGKGKGEPKE